ncbi:unsaturated chondroitin disaccharide hydrolase [Alkalihalobacillus xiaoxiensis]|uniref:Unsaturated chondroitin disaccharide hydrolase n=1 Tax=Shouchella xiaoxiensis TaxID=766895 RepID=A0ABS2SNS3_9BACI|nr:glycoside hydrolase family 88 protein [Shouchella xiaoxiensis]MBM7837163.1 unsaturated chondroitin disaccharide hydrolase [Shouchella xiaoxiensis]
MISTKTSMTLEQLNERTMKMMQQIGGKSPHATGTDGRYDDLEVDWWTSGFYPGLLWLMHDMTGEVAYREEAEGWGRRIEAAFEAHPIVLHHDVGFQFLLTAVMDYEQTGSEDGLRIGLKAANYLAGRFNPAGSFIKAWNGSEKKGWAIIDCMMNISLLYWASKVTGDPSYGQIASLHADTTLKYGVREDGSTSHILSFDPYDGSFIESIGGQGEASDSAWSRGNAWALYGFANAYRHTGTEAYLSAAKKIAHHFIAALPADFIPLWDFRCVDRKNPPKDSSAAAIAASGLLELEDHVSVHEKHLYGEAARSILKGLTTHALTPAGSEAILTDATGNFPIGRDVNVSLIYGDYYFAEALAKVNGWKRRIF